MKYLLDTDTLIYWLKGNRNIERKAIEAGFDQLGYSIISKAELFYGAYNSQHPTKNLVNVARIDAVLTLVYLEDTAAEWFGKLKADLRRQGNPIMDADLFIAATTLAHGLVLVSNNTKHFQRIPDLMIENWA